MGVPESAPVSDVITAALSFPQANRFFASGKAGAAVDFDFTENDVTEPVGAVADGEGVFLVVTEWMGGISATVTIGDGTTDLDIAGVDGPGVHYAGKAGAAIAAANVSVPGSTFGAGQSASGYVLVVEERGA